MELPSYRSTPNPYQEAADLALGCLDKKVPLIYKPGLASLFSNLEFPQPFCTTSTQNQTAEAFMGYFPLRKTAFQSLIASNL